MIICETTASDGALTTKTSVLTEPPPQRSDIKGSRLKIIESIPDGSKTVVEPICADSCDWNHASVESVGNSFSVTIAGLSVKSSEWKVPPHTTIAETAAGVVVYPDESTMVTHLTALGVSSSSSSAAHRPLGSSSSARGENPSESLDIQEGSAYLQTYDLKWLLSMMLLVLI
uniref:Uncharacterized protein n=1 Tax=Candidozyma auris TaxID=498019 RepID=A0A0L0NZ49_CANAR